LLAFLLRRARASSNGSNYFLKRFETYASQFLTEKIDSKICKVIAALRLGLNEEGSQMASKTNRSITRQAPVLIPADLDHVDQMVRVARDLSGFVLILDSAAVGEPVLAAVARILEPINEQLQDFRAWFHDGWCVATRTVAKSGGKSNG
jgi:hypothetical protein